MRVLKAEIAGLLKINTRALEKLTTLMRLSWLPFIVIEVVDLQNKESFVVATIFAKTGSAPRSLVYRIVLMII